MRPTAGTAVHRNWLIQDDREALKAKLEEIVRIPKRPLNGMDTENQPAVQSQREVMRESPDRRMSCKGVSPGRPRLAIGIGVIRENFWCSGLFLSRRVCDNQAAVVRDEFAVIPIQQSKHCPDSSGQTQQMSRRTEVFGNSNS